MNMKTRSVVPAVLMACLLAGPLTPHAAQTPPLELIPGDTQVIITADANAIMNSDIAKSILEANPQASAVLQIVQNLTGADLKTDLQRLTFYGRIDDKTAGGVIAQGHFDQDKILSLLQANPRYTFEEIGGMQVHRIPGNTEENTRYGLFDSDSLAVCNSRSALETYLAVSKDKTISAAPLGKTAPFATPSTVQVALFNVEDHGPAARYALSALSGQLDLADSEIRLQLMITPRSETDVARWLDLLRGMSALGQLQPDLPELRAMGSQATIGASEDGQSAILAMRMDQEDFIGILEKEMARKAARAAETDQP